jgi:FkbM family methyltransferase
LSQGRSEAYRAPSWLERAAAAVRDVLPPHLVGPLRGTYRRLLGTTSADRFVCTLPNGERVRILPQYRQLTWNPEEYAAFREAVAPGAVILDVGANLGAYALILGMWVGPSGRVFAFEPAPEPFAGLLALVAANGLADRVSAHQVAVSDQEGVAAFLARGLHGANRLAPAGVPSDDLLRIPSTTIDAFCRRMAVQPDFIKIDAEGAELNVLKGARDTIEAVGSRLQLFVELHPHLWHEFGASRAALEAEFDRQRLQPERLDGRPDVWTIEGVCLRLRRCAS